MVKAYGMSLLNTSTQKLLICLSKRCWLVTDNSALVLLVNSKYLFTRLLFEHCTGKL